MGLLHKTLFFDHQTIIATVFKNPFPKMRHGDDGITVNESGFDAFETQIQYALQQFRLRIGLGAELIMGDIGWWFHCKHPSPLSQGRYLVVQRNCHKVSRLYGFEYG